MKTLEDSWDRTLYGIAVKYEPKIVRIKTEPVLLAYLKKRKNSALTLSDRIRSNYRKRMGCELLISRHSLAIEILGHTYLDVIVEAAEALQLSRIFFNALEKVKRSTEIIDCGERDVDTNRFIWDSLEPFHAVIYEVLGNRS